MEWLVEKMEKELYRLMFYWFYLVCLNIIVFMYLFEKKNKI